MTNRRLKLFVAIAFSVYAIAFLFLFQPFTGVSLVTETGAFLGPPLRQNPDFEDIGKIYIYHGNLQHLYFWFAPLCWAWGIFNMFTWWFFNV